MKNILIYICLFLLLCGSVFSQDTIKPAVQTEIVDGDTIALVEMKEVVIIPPVKIETRRQAARYDRLVYNVKKVYPYAKLASQKLKYYKTILDTIPNEKQRKVYLKKAEKELEAQFGNEIRELTFSQGRILIKLIYRETGNSTYDIVKELRGGFSAFIYQTIARVFGYDLRSDYDPQGEDIVIENIVVRIEAGEL